MILKEPAAFEVEKLLDFSLMTVFIISRISLQFS